MGEHDTIFNFLPGYANFETWASHYLQRHAGIDAFPTYFTMTHVLVSVTVALVLLLAGLSYRRRLAHDSDAGFIPESRLGVRTVFEAIIDFALGLVAGVMGQHKAEKFFPLLGGLFFFILFNNLIGLVPGFLSPTDTLKTNIGLALLVFLVTHVMGVINHGVGPYLKHFVAPVLELPLLIRLPLIPMFFLIEMVGHVARPVSLSVRLMGNMMGDHKVLVTFFTLVPLLVPLPFYLLGILVCVVQTLVFTLLTAVYIELATEDAH